MHIYPIKPRLCMLLLTLLAGLLLVSCGPAGAPPPAATTQPATAAALPAAVTATLAPAATETPASPATEVAAPTATPAEATATVEAPAPTEAATSVTPAAPAASAAEGLSAWCLPENTALAYAADPAHPPANARIGHYAQSALEVPNLPASACVFLYAFDQPAAGDLKLEVYELNQKAPWLTADLAPLEGQPGVVSAMLRHTYIIAPPFWNISYVFAVRDALGQELRRDTVNLHRWVPKPCWNGQLPNVNTLRCPLRQDLHPWDAGYGTPIPTFAPDED